MKDAEKLPLLKISQNQRYLITEDHRPFFWLGDTAWEMVHRLNEEEVRLYLEDRVSKGFTVIQTVLLAELDGLNSPNAYGHTPLINQDPKRINEAYFAYVDQIIEQAATTGLYMAVLPTWGDKFHKAWGLGPEIFTEDNAEAYGEILGRRYAHHSHIVWVMGGDRTPTHDNHYKIIRAMAKGIKRHTPNHLMTYHPNGGKIASDWFGTEDWLDFDMFQTRHQKGFKEYQFTRKALNAQPARPVIDGEPGYENIPNLLNKWKLNRLKASDIRKTAYWNLFAGAAGHTYGCNEVWQMFDEGRKPKFGAEFSWKEAIHLPGSYQMGLMRKLFSSLDWQNLTNDQQLLSPSIFPGHNSILSMISTQRTTVLVYTPNGRAFRLKLSKVKADKLQAYWFDPSNGELHQAGIFINSGTVKFKAPRSIFQDAVLLLLDQQIADQWLQTYSTIPYPNR